MFPRRTLSLRLSTHAQQLEEAQQFFITLILCRTLASENDSCKNHQEIEVSMTRKVLEHGWSPLPSMEFHMKLIEIVRLNSVRKENVIEFHERLRKQKNSYYLFRSYCKNIRV